MPLNEQERDALVEELAEAIDDARTPLTRAYAANDPEIKRIVMVCLPIIERLLAERDAQIKYLRDYGFSKAAELMSAMNGGNTPTKEQLASVLGSIDSNMLIAAERAAAVTQARQQQEGTE